MVIKRSNLLVTIGGFIGLFSGFPAIWGKAMQEGYVHAAMPGWLYLTCVMCVPISVFIVGVAAKGQDEHSTTDQVQKASTDGSGNPKQS